jgi:hypothetical protein
MMPVVDITDASPGERWNNYHKSGYSILKKRFALRSAELDPGRTDVAEGAVAVRNWLMDARDKGVPVRPVGGAWSPSNIQTVRGGWMLNTRRFNRCFKIAQADLAAGIDLDARELMLVEGGTQIDEINDRLESKPMRRSLRSSGASNGQTLAGACATGTHGSVLEAGGIQEHVVAVQIVTPDDIFWIEPASGVMGDSFIAATGSTTTLRDDEVFAAAQVAVGCLGVVTAMVIRTEPVYLVRPYLKLIDFSREDLETLARGDFLAFANNHGPTEDEGGPCGDLYFVMVVANPHKPFGRATVRLLYKTEWREDHVPVKEPGKLGQGYDSFTMLGWALRTFPWARGWLVRTIMHLAVGKGIRQPIFGTWGETTELHKPLADIFTGALVCGRADLTRAFPLACTAFTEAGGSTAVTMRFMKGGHGLLSPARWEDTAGIDFDGPCGDATEAAYLKIVEALDSAAIAFTRHWGKFNHLDADRVARDYGDDLAHWKRVQDRLLPNIADRSLFATQELRHLGLI